MKIAEARKAVAAASAAAAQFAAYGLLDGAAEKLVSGTLAAAGAFLVYYLENEPKPTSEPGAPAPSE